MQDADEAAIDEIDNTTTASTRPVAKAVGNGALEARPIGIRRERRQDADAAETR